MHLFEVTAGKRYSPITLANSILHIWEKEKMSKEEYAWLLSIARNDYLKGMLLKLATKYGYTANYEPNHPFLDDAATCASAYSVLCKL